MLVRRFENTISSEASREFSFHISFVSRVPDQFKFTIQSSENWRFLLELISSKNIETPEIKGKLLLGYLWNSNLPLEASNSRNL